MFNEDIYSDMEGLGLKPPEIKVYLTCLVAKPGLTIQKITDETGLKRSTVNLIVGRLEAKGFISHFISGKRKAFAAEPPERLAYQLERTSHNFRETTPLLQALTHQEIKQSTARFFEGKENIKRIYEEGLLSLKNAKTNREIVGISAGEYVYELMPDHDKHFVQKRIKEQIPVRWIAPHTPFMQNLVGMNEKYRKIKLFNKNRYEFAISFWVYGNKLAIIDPDIKNPSACVIQNSKVATSMRSLFNLLWDSLPDAV